MPRTNQGILVTVPGDTYTPYCNRCGWKSKLHSRNIPDAQVVARSHATGCKK